MNQAHAAEVLHAAPAYVDPSRVRAPVPDFPDRPDMYRLVHKGLRSYMVSVLAMAGRADPADDCEIAETLDQVRALLDICRDHLEHENEHVHAAMESRLPGSTASTSDDHMHHLAAIDQLGDRVADVASAGSAGRAAALLHLYRGLALFVAENFEHMQVEEMQNNAVLWQTHTDEELMAVEQAIVSSIPPDRMMQYLRWMVPAVNAAERAAFLGGIRLGVPAEAFQQILAAVEPHLTERDRYKLRAALEPMPLAA